MKKILGILAAALIAFSGLVVPFNAYAEGESDNNCGAVILADCCKEDGEGIQCILKMVVDIFSAGVGILGVVGICIVGIQYLTAADNEEQLRKSKKRLIDIIIGLLIYACMYALLSFLLPNFS